ncbi:MAG: DUF1588 domain-containing protein [Aureliella sp.]
MTPLVAAKQASATVLTWLTISGHFALAEDRFTSEIRPLLQTYCVDCHSGVDANGSVDLDGIQTLSDAEDHYDILERAVDLIESRNMPPEDSEQPTASERKNLADWYVKKFVQNVEPRPGIFSPRRLSAVEYRNTLRSLFGFDLEVAILEAEQTVVEKSLVIKLLPADPPGRSGFCNDTHSSPLTTNTWDQYSYLADVAIEELFSAKRSSELRQLIGRPDATGLELLTRASAKQLLTRFVRLAARRTDTGEQLSESLKRLDEADDILTATKAELKTTLMSPTFLYRGLLAKKKPGQQATVDPFELAERLSYFLWADMPDRDLFTLAESGDLAISKVLHQQVDRMLDSPKSQSLAEDFAGQWLGLADIEQVSNEAPFLAALKEQPIALVHYLIQEDRPLLEIIDCDVTFANPLLRRFYGKDLDQLPKYRKPKGIEVERVPLKKIKLNTTVGRGGILTLPGIVAMNRGPIIRGTWMLERILGEHLPDPPANVGQVQPNRSGESLSFRERFEQHRSEPSCALCHDKIDPLGFAFETYDSGGGYTLAANYRPPKKSQPQPNGSEPIDTSGRLPSGETFDDLAGLKQVLMTSQRRKVIKNLVERMLSYALCRRLEYFDQPIVDSIVGRVQGRGTFRQLIHEIVDSLPFRQAEFSGEAK